MTPTSPTDRSSLLAQADLLLLLAEAFRTPTATTPPFASDVTPGDLRLLVGTAALPDAAALVKALLACRRAAARLPRQACVNEHYRLFEGPMRCPINETAYIRRDKGAILADVCGFYRAFGWEPAPGSAEKPDHLVCELEFVAALLVMVAAEPVGDDRQAGVTRAALTHFVADHLGDWVAAICDQLALTTATTFHERLAAALHQVWTALAAHHHWPAASAPVAPTDESDTPLECIVPAATVPLTVHQSEGP